MLKRNDFFPNSRGKRMGFPLIRTCWLSSSLSFLLIDHCGFFKFDEKRPKMMKSLSERERENTEVDILITFLDG